MKIIVPKVIKIGSHEYEVMFDALQEDREFRGTLLVRTHKILLNPSLHPQQLRVTFIHELFHLACEFNDLTPPESDVVGVSEALSDILFRSFDIDLDFSEVPTLERKEKE